MGAHSVLSLLWLRLRKLAVALTTERTRAALRIGVTASIEHREALRGSNFRTVVDVGANRGQFALFCRTEFPQARIISFEPLSAPAARFRKLFGNDELVTLHEMALGSVAGSSIIHVTAEDDSSSLLAVGDTQATVFGTREVASQAVTVRRLDEVVTPAMLSAPALLKIDVQGFEMEVLRGAGEILSSFASVYAECSYLELYSGQALVNEAIEFLHSAGFALAGIFNQATDGCGRPVQADVLFHRSAVRDNLTNSAIFEEIKKGSGADTGPQSVPSSVCPWEGTRRHNAAPYPTNHEPSPPRGKGESRFTSTAAAWCIIRSLFAQQDARTA